MHWVTNMRSQRFKRVLGVVLTVAWNEESQAPWTQEDEAKPPREPFAHELKRLFSAKRRSRTIKPEELATLRVSVPDYLVLSERRRPTGKGFETKDYRVVFKRTLLSPELDVKPLVRDLLERVDNRSTIPEIIAKHAEETAQSLKDIEDRCQRALLVMFERGLVTLDPIGAEKKTPEQKAPAADPLAASQEPDEDEGHGTMVERERGQTMLERERPRTIMDASSSGEADPPRRRHDTPPE